MAASLGVGACGTKTENQGGPFERTEACAVSHILVSARRGGSLGEGKARMRQIQARIAAGESFAQVATTMSDDPSSAPDGGFIGFVPTWNNTPFSGAVQVLLPGETRGPLASELGLQLLHRHPYEEGRALERASRIAAHGFFVSSRESLTPRDRSAEEARRMAEEAFAKVKAGELTLEAAARAYGDDPPARDDALLHVVGRGPNVRWIYDALASVPEGSLAPAVVAGPGTYAVLARGRFFRAIVRHVLVAHIESKGRDAGSIVTRQRDEAAKRALQALTEARPDGSNWSALVTKYSDDLGSVSTEGSLGLCTTGVLPLELERAVLETAPGQIARGIVETPGGFHVVYRVD